MEHPDAIPPFHECRCRVCAMAREESIPAKLRALARRQLIATSMSTFISDALIHRALQMYVGGHVGLAEMQIELIYALVKQLDDSTKQLSDLLAMQPLGLPKRS